MKIAILLSLAILNLVYGLPVGMDQQLLPQEQRVQEAVANTDAMASLTELSDLGRARFLWGGIWAGPYWPLYYYSYYRPWSYRYGW